jgi:hypothetical protein
MHHSSGKPRQFPISNQTMRNLIGGTLLISLMVMCSGLAILYAEPIGIAIGISS